jgi:predicted nucleic-acid-binding Zn-ribbon protein
LTKNEMRFSMAKCPKCGTENIKPMKEWNYAAFHVEKFNCPKCATNFREYTKHGTHSFTLIMENGKYQRP